MSDYKPRTAKTGRAWLTIFTLANGRAPTMREFAAAVPEFEDTAMEAQRTPKFLDEVGKLLKSLEDGKKQ